MFEFGGSLQEILVILVVALLVVGPKRLPEVGRMLARAMRELRRAHDEVRSTLETNLQLDAPDPVPSPGEPTAAVGSSAVSAPEASRLSSDSALSALSVEATETGAHPYLGQRGARLFHTTDCRWAARVKGPERLGFESEGDATAQGFLPCPVCQPRAE
jgi:Tat protein translocase TatB subunit